jgi:LysR family transcriptional regulator, glycine cleavage system transcriptional activator
MMDLVRKVHEPKIHPLDDPPDARRLDAQLLSDLWVFRAAARLESVTAAAQRLRVTQGAISQRILRLEARLEAPLFLRRKGRIQLTDAGQTLLAAMTQVAEVLNSSLSSIERVKRNAIVVSCVPSLATEWLVPHLAEFYLLYPDVEVFVRSEMVPSTAERFEDDRIDVIIDYHPQAPTGVSQLFELQEYATPVCSPRYRELLATSKRPEAPIILQDDSACLGTPVDFEWTSWRSAAKVDWPKSPAMTRHFNVALLAYHAAMCNQGVAIGRAVLINRLLSKGELVSAFDAPPVPASFYRMLTNRPGSANSPVRRFAKWCRDGMARTQESTLALLTGD